MEKLVRGTVSNVIVEYIEYKKDSYYDRKETIIKKKTSFSINNDIFYTFEDIEPIEGEEEIFYINEENKITFFGKKQVEKNLEKEEKKKSDYKKEIRVFRLLTFITVIINSFITYNISLDIEDVSLFKGLLIFFILMLLFSLSIGCFFGAKSSKKDLENLEEKTKEEKAEFDIFNKTPSNLISTRKKEVEEIQIVKENISIINCNKSCNINNIG